ncbi:MAG: hypothetical protein IKQ16_04270 [Lentisphaeria bacterium]|nr:hypothetical protein [Lentisphaeria bacterium]
MPFLFKIIAILIGIFVWKSVVGSFRKASKAMHDDSYDEDGDDTASAARLDLEGQWRQAAEQLACTFEPGDAPNLKKASISGRFSGHAITIKRFGHGYVRYFVAFRKAPGFRVCVVRDLETIAERILDGHPVFPSKMFFPSGEPDFYCSAESEDAFDLFLNTPSNRSAVLNLVHLFPAGMFNNEGVSVRLRASAPDISVISSMAAIANALEAPSSTPMPDLSAATKQAPIPIPSAAVRPASVRATKTSKIPLSSNAADSSQRTTVIRISPEARRTRKFDTRKADIVRSTPERTAPAPATPEKTPAPAQKPAAPADSTLTVESVCAALFSKAFPGTEERAAFEAMKGRRVRWSGELLMSLPFSMDFVFGSRKGVKATLLVHKLGQGSVPVQIKAVAAFPPELREQLESAKGKTIVFEGDLLKFEPFAREIYLQDASLES